MKVNIIKITLLSCLLTIGSYTQETPATESSIVVKNVEAGFDGLLAVSYSSDTWGINVGGQA